MKNETIDKMKDAPLRAPYLKKNDPSVFAFASLQIAGDVVSTEGACIASLQIASDVVSAEGTCIPCFPQRMFSNCSFDVFFLLFLFIFFCFFSDFDEDTSISIVCNN